MGGNRVEELESNVRELEATVDGLTDELLECKERLEALEEEVDPDMDIIEGGIATSSSEPSVPPADEAAGAEPPGSDAETAADTDNTDGDEADDESDASDIIVA